MTSTSKEEYAKKIVEFLKVQEHLPYFIRRNNFKRKCHFCQFGHEGLLVKSYDSEKKLFTCVHGNESGIGRTYPHDSSQLRDYLAICFKRRTIHLTPIRKAMDLSDLNRKYIVQFRVTKKEKLQMEKKAAKKGISIGEYARRKALY